MSNNYNEQVTISSSFSFHLTCFLLHAGLHHPTEYC